MIFNLLDDQMTPNFSIVGGIVEPQIRTSNTIWVNTDKEITGYYISNIAPASPSEGVVWIHTGCTNVDSFLPFKTDSINVYPVRALQYINSVWCNVQARRYHDDKYTDWWNGAIYNNGYSVSKWTKVPIDNGISAPAYTTVKHNNLTCLRISNVKEQDTDGTILTDKINLTGYRTLTCTILNSYSADGNAYSFGIGVWPYLKGSTAPAYVKKYELINFDTVSNTERSITIDVSDLSGNTPYHIGFSFNNNLNNAPTDVSYVTVSKLQLT